MSAYETKTERVPVRGGDDLIIRSLKDTQQFDDDPDGAAEALGISSAMWPIFGVIWPSARILADLVNSLDLRGRRVLEVGCGIGLASIVAHRAGADVTASDVHPLVEPFLAENMALNDLPPIRFEMGNWDAPNAHLGRFDLIIGSDLLYEDGHPAALSGFIDRHSADPAEVIIIGPSRGHVGRFIRAMEALGFTASQAPAPPIDDGVPAAPRRVLTFRRDSNAAAR